MEKIKSILCLNGTDLSLPFLQKYKHLPFVAADGAAHKLLAGGITPQWIVGDFDSFQGASPPASTHIQHTDQNFTDFEKTLFHIKSLNLFPTLVCGAFGGEIDHMLYNMQTLILYGRSHDMVFYSTEKQWIFPIYQSLTFQGKPREKISLIPAPSATITTKGLVWNLYDEEISFLGKASVRNQIKDKNVTITLHQGSYFLITKSFYNFF